MTKKIYIYCTSLCLLIACVNNNEIPTTNQYQLQLPTHFPSPSIPTNNPLTKEAIALGKKLFFDPILSRDSSIACNSCHHPALAFSDSVAISPGVDGRLGLRNAPTLMNAAWLQLINKDGGITKLDLQAMTPIEDHEEMDISVLKVAEKLNAQADYVALSNSAYQRPLDPFVITRSLAAYLRTLVTVNSPYDHYLEGNTKALSEAAIRGKEIFFGQAKCSQCHSGFNFTNNAFENNGLYSEYKDNGRQRVTLLPADEGKFRVPTLRNIKLTAPYMHDGSLKTLKEVITHYNTGGKAHANKSALIQQINLSTSEIEDLESFLWSLTDVSIKTSSI